MRDFGTIGDRNTNGEGCRQRLRVALRALGVTQKFRTDLLKDGTLMVISAVALSTVLDKFEGHVVRYIVRLS